MHPLADNLFNLSDDELDKKYNELSRRWHIAKRMGMDEYTLHQLDILLTGMEDEKYRRAAIPESDNTVLIDTDPIPTQEENNDGNNTNNKSNNKL